MNDKGKHFKIILAEDSEADAQLVRLALCEHGVNCEVNVVGDGAKVIQEINELDSTSPSSALDLLILDMHLPSENGEAVLNSLRSTVHYQKTPIVVLGREDAKLVARQAEGFPALIFFDKPSSLDEFMQLGALVRIALSVAKKPKSRSDAIGSASAA